MSFEASYHPTRKAEVCEMIERELRNHLIIRNIPHLHDYQIVGNVYLNIKIRQQVEGAIFSDFFSILIRNNNDSRLPYEQRPLTGISVVNNKLESPDNGIRCQFSNSNFITELLNFISGSLIGNYRLAFDHRSSSDILNLIMRKAEKSNSEHPFIEMFNLTKHGDYVIMTRMNNMTVPMAIGHDGQLRVQGNPEVLYDRIQIETIDDNPNCLTVRQGEQLQRGEAVPDGALTHTLNQGTRHQVTYVFHETREFYDFSEFVSIDQLVDTFIDNVEKLCTPRIEGHIGPTHMDEIGVDGRRASAASQMKVISRLIDVVQKLNDRVSFQNTYK